jgi:anti-sigma regulatory factor (Ser/Thr protein kinase)
MSDEKAIYWLTQVSGWFGYILLILFQNLLLGNVDLGIVKVLFANFALGIAISHLMRALIVRSGMLSMKILNVIPRIIAIAISAGVISSVLYGLISDLFFRGGPNVPEMLEPPFVLLIELIFPFTTIYLFWSILYFAAIYLKNYEREEVKNLRLSSSMNEVELGNLRAQLNPHFMFNALNSIRALVDENPEQAKVSITQMSRILRSSLLAGRRNLVTLREEADLVSDYLALEKIRYEERLEYEIDIPDHLLSKRVPPILLQTLAENAVKHGISTLPKGGKIRIQAEAVQGNGTEEVLKLTVANSGTFDPGKNATVQDTSVGIANSRRRLRLLFGDHAAMTIFNKGEEVKCEVIIPLTIITQNGHENIDD